MNKVKKNKPVQTGTAPIKVDVFKAEATLEPHPSDSQPGADPTMGWPDQQKESKPEADPVVVQRGREGGGDDLRAIAAMARQSGGRVPLGGHHLKLSVKDWADQLEGFVPRWVKDDGARLQRALKGGYVPVYKDSAIMVGDGEDLNTDLGSWVSEITGTSEGGQPQRSYLMKLREEWYKADQAAKLKPVDEVEQAIREGAYKHNPNDSAGGRFSREISFETNKR